MPPAQFARRVDDVPRSVLHRCSDCWSHGGNAPCGSAAMASLLARIGLPRSATGSLDPAAEPLTTDEREAALSRLEMERRRWKRLARTRHPAYDLDRHIAVYRLIAALDPNALAGRSRIDDDGTAPRMNRAIARPQ